MLVIGLIGQIGSGKSTAGQFFQALGVPVIDSDHVARAVIERPDIQQQIIQYFGPSVWSADHQLDRQHLKQCIFNNSVAKQWLEQLLHPVIEQEVKQQLQALHAPYAIVLLPLLPEASRRTYLNRILVIETHAHLQQARVLARDAMCEELLKKIIDSQASCQQLRAVADDTLINHHDFADLQAQILTLHLRYLALAKAHKTTSERH